jgi:ATP/maltotriose-dependent transcriptional regulator MalT
MLQRERISERLAASARKPVTLLAAPAGYGKSTALDEYLRTLPGEVLRFDVRRTHGSLTRFVRALAAALEPALPRIGQSLAIAHERATQSAKPSEVLATWLAGHLGGAARTIVIDDFHHCSGETGIAAFVASAIERTRSHVRWIVATRSSADLPVATWLARGDSDIPLDESTLRITAREAMRIATTLAPAIGEGTVMQLLDVTHGAPAIFSFGLQTIAQEPQIAERLLSSGGDPFCRFADEVFERFSPAERKRLIETAVFSEFDETLLTYFEEPLPEATRAPQIFDVRSGRMRYHVLFHARLREHLSELGHEAERDATLRAASALERAGRIGEALAIYIRERQDEELVRVIEAHGFAFHEAGYGEAMQEAIGALDPLLQMTSAVVLAIKAMSESASGRFDTAESWFQLALDRAADPLRTQIGYQYGTHLLRFFRREAVGVLEGLVVHPQVEDELRAYVLAALGPAHVFERRLDEARRATAEALVLSKKLGNPHLVAKTHHQAAYVALYGGEAERAKHLASISLAYANEHGYFDIAAGALSVLYNVACDIDDDPNESVRLLEAAGDCAAKSGSLVNQLNALVAGLEIEIERNDEVAAARIDEKLRALDVSLSGRATYEALLPTQALRACWDGDFLGAYRLLSTSAENQWSPDRKALRYAEIAAYAAAAGLEYEAADAMRSACQTLSTIDDVDLRVQRARLYVTLTAIVLGRTEFAQETLAEIDADPQALSARLLALRRALGALFERYRGARNHNELLACLAAMDECGLAGVARAITMLPLSDNALRRVDRLTVAERTAALRMIDGDFSAADERLPAIARKLGCVRREAVVRAAIWHRAAFERTPVSAYAMGGS